MAEQINIGILGYGNLARGAEAAIANSSDLKLCAVYTRRAPESVTVHTKGVPVFKAETLDQGDAPVDVLLLCGGSATDLPEQTPKYAALYNTVDSFDTHARIPEHFAATDRAAKRGGHCALISCGWDPGLFSLNRVYAEAVLPDGEGETFWGRGVSQGHSDAIRRIKGVADARQYTNPSESAIEAFRSGKNVNLTTREKHTRECYVVVTKEADNETEKERITREIREMPNYFAEYDTTVTFITEEEMKRDHGAMPHGGRVIRTGRTGFERENRQVIEYALTLSSNPEFTASAIVAYARAVYRLAKEGKTGACTVFDIAPAYLSARTGEDLRAHFL